MINYVLQWYTLSFILGVNNLFWTIFLIDSEGLNTPSLSHTVAY